MSNYNRVILMGRLTRDPEVRKTSSGTSVAALAVAVSETYRNAAGEKVEKPCFVDVETWGDQADNCGKYLRKGRPLMIDGKLLMDEWESAKGERRTKLKVRAQTVIFLSDGGARTSGSGEERGPRSTSNRAAQKPVAAGVANRTDGEDGDSTPF